MTGDLQSQLLAYLREHQVLTLATSDADGQPYAASLFYAVDDDLNFYVVSDPTTRHGAAMLRDGRVAVTVHRDRQKWQDARGVQFTGRCHRLTGTARAAGWAVYMKRFAFLQDVTLPGLGQLAAAPSKVDLWKIEPSWFRLVDNGQSFAHKEEWTRPRSAQLRHGLDLETRAGSVRSEPHQVARRRS